MRLVALSVRSGRGPVSGGAFFLSFFLSFSLSLFLFVAPLGLEGSAWELGNLRGVISDWVVLGGGMWMTTAQVLTVARTQLLRLRRTCTFHTHHVHVGNLVVR